MCARNAARKQTLGVLAVVWVENAATNGWSDACVCMNIAKLKNKIKTLPARTEVTVSINGRIFGIAECEYFRSRGVEYDDLILCFLPELSEQDTDGDI